MSTCPDYAFEHVAINVAEPEEMAKWYEKNLGMTIVRTAAFGTHFLADTSGRVVIEIYKNSNIEILDYPNLHQSTLHLAFIVNSVKETREKLVTAGASIVDDILTTDAGDEMLMLKDPWGVTIQFITRAMPMLKL